MENPRQDNFFRNRRWFLLLLGLASFAAYRLVPRPTVGAWLAHYLNARVGGPGLTFWGHSVAGLAATLLGLGALWRTWGSAYLGAHVVQDKEMHTNRLVGDGPYRHTRNPLYFGNMLMVLGLGLLFGPVACLVLVVGMWILIHLFIRDEEAGLEQSRGESYRAYCAAVPRLVPAWRPRIPAAGARAHWLQGICGEGMLWMLTILTTGLAITLNPEWFRQGLLWGVVIAAPVFIWARRHGKVQAASESA
jgi:protein-S-isoprenylcysteine O-methyltransferase Ste14